MKKLFCIDLDGTTLISYKDMHPRMLEASKKIEEFGDLLIISTGRNISSAIKFYNFLNLKTPIVCGNGALVIDIANDKVMIDVKMNVEVNKLVNEHFGGLIANSYYYLDGKNYIINNDDLIKKRMNDGGSDMEVRPLKNDDELNSAVIIAKEGDVPALDKIFESIPDVVVRNWGGDDYHNYLEVNPISADKWYGILEVAKMYGVDESNIYTFGDANNDLMMTTKCVNSVAVKNAIDELKAVANTVLDETHKEGGVANYILNLYK